MITITGYVHTTGGDPIPGASAVITDSNFNSRGIGGAANSLGYFSFNADENSATFPWDYLVISSVGYRSKALPLDTLEPGRIITLEESAITLPPVVVTSGSKSFPWALALIPIAMLMNDKKKGRKRVGALKLDTPTVITVGIALVGLKAFGLLNNLLDALGLQAKESTRNLDAASENPLSPWSPQFYLNAPPGSAFLTEAQCQQMYTTIQKAFGPLNDDEGQVISVFKTLRTQSQLSVFSLWLANYMNIDILDWLRGGVWPSDRLSDNEVDSINQFILKLPKYTV